MLIHWLITIAFLTASLFTGRMALFTNGGNGNTGWFLSFWAVSIGLAIISCLLCSKTFHLKSTTTVKLTVAVSIIVFLFSNPVGLFVFFAIPLLLLFYLLVTAILITTPIRIVMIRKANPDRL